MNVRFTGSETGGIRNRLVWEGQCTSGWYEPPRLLYDTELVVTSEGPFMLEIDGRPTLMRPGAAALIPPATWHRSWVAGRLQTRRFCVHFGWTGEDLRHLPLMSLSAAGLRRGLVQALPPGVAAVLPLVLEPEQMAPAAPLVALVQREVHAGSRIADLTLAALVGFMLAGRAGPAAGLARGTRGRAALAIKHLIDSRYPEALGYGDYIRASGLSRGHLCTSFHRLVGMAPNDYLLEVRIEQAQRLLATTAQSVAAIARAVGIADSNYFTRLFRQRRGQTPRRYREAAAAAALA